MKTTDETFPLIFLSYEVSKIWCVCQTPSMSRVDAYWPAVAWASLPAEEAAPATAGPQPPETQHLGWADLTASGLCHWVYKAASPLPGGAASGDPLTLKLGSRVHDPFPHGGTAASHLTNTQGRGSVDGEPSLGKAGR